MTIKEAKEAVKSQHPNAVCCSIMKIRTWHVVVRSKRNGEPIGEAISVCEVGFEGRAWKSAAQKLVIA